MHFPRDWLLSVIDNFDVSNGNLSAGQEWTVDQSKFDFVLFSTLAKDGNELACCKKYIIVVLNNNRCCYNEELTLFYFNMTIIRCLHWYPCCYLFCKVRDWILKSSVYICSQVLQLPLFSPPLILSNLTDLQ